MTMSWVPVVVVDMVGSIAVLLLAVLCVLRALNWTRLKPDDVFRQYIFLLTLSIFFFAVSRSCGHLLKQILLLNGNRQLWESISPFSGAVNTVTFIVVFAFGVYFYRFQKVHAEIENYKNNLELLVEKRTAQLEASKIHLENEIRARKKNQLGLAEEKEKLAVTLRSIGDGVLTTDTDGRVVLLNKVAENLTGWNSTDASGKKVEEVFHIINQKTRQRCENPVEKILSAGQIMELEKETILIAKNGREINVADSCAPIIDSGSNIVGVVLVFRDITEKRRMEEEHYKMEKLQSVGVLAGGIAHDFNNILAAILGNINLAMIYTEPTDKRYNILADAEKASIRAKGLTQQLLTFSKGGSPVREIASVDEVIVESANFVTRGSKVKCEYKMAPNLWPVAIDTGQISQVVQNLILNARYAMGDEGVIVVVCENIVLKKGEIPQLAMGKYIKISVSDTGVGIPEESLHKVFDPYFSTKSEGNGLGLAIADSIVKKHDGAIIIESEVGKGSTFTIFIPAEFSTENQEPEAAISCVPIPDTGRRTVLVMDDEKMVLDVAEAMLNFLGCDVILARNGEEAVCAYQDAQKEGREIDIVIVDLTIPGGMGGKETAEAIHSINGDAKIVVSSGYSSDPVMAEYKKFGFCASIAKPYHIKDLEKVVGKVLAHSSS